MKKMKYTESSVLTDRLDKTGIKNMIIEFISTILVLTNL